MSGAGLFQDAENGKVHVHRTTQTTIGTSNEIDLTSALGSNEKICAKAPIFVVQTELDGSVTGEIIKGFEVDENDGTKLTVKDSLIPKVTAGDTVFVDYYVIKDSKNVSELQIDAENFAGYYYVEASTLFRDQASGRDLPAELTFPNVKIQSNFTFSMASTGDPSTFTFTMDAFPGYTYFNKTRKVLCAIEIVNEDIAKSAEGGSVFIHSGEEKIDESNGDSASPKVGE